MAEFSLRNRDLSRLTLTVTVPRWFRFRVWLGVQTIRLGCIITGCSIDVKQMMPQDEFHPDPEHDDSAQ